MSSECKYSLKEVTTKAQQKYCCLSDKLVLERRVLFELCSRISIGAQDIDTPDLLPCCSCYMVYCGFNDEPAHC